MAGLQTWIYQFWQDLRPTPGRLGISLRIVLASVLTLVLLMTLRIPAAPLALYFIFLLGRESPAVSLRSGIVALLAVSAAVAAQLAVVIATDNDPIARVLSVALIGSIGGVIISSTTVPSVGTMLGFIFCSGFSNWELHRPADALVRASLWLVGSCAIGIGCAVFVEYAFGLTNPVKRLEQQLQMRYEALEKLFHLLAVAAAAEDLFAATVQVSRLAAAGQRGMQELHNSIVERYIGAGVPPFASDVHIAMLAQLMDLSAALGSQNRSIGDRQAQERFSRVAEQCRNWRKLHSATGRQSMEVTMPQPVTLLDHIESVLNKLQSMPKEVGPTNDQKPVALSSKRASLLIPNAVRSQENVAFALKLSLCATICYVFYHAVDWRGISTCVTTVFITALSTRGAIHQKLAQRVMGCIIGGLVLAIGATAFLFPHMDSITSLAILVAVVAFLAAWCATGRRFSYVGLQIAVAFYLVAFEGFGPATELAPARDRFAGIAVGLIVMWIVFGEIWPVRTLTVMRRKLVEVLRNTAMLFKFGASGQRQNEELRDAEALRGHVGKAVAELRTLNDAAGYEFGSDRRQQMDAGDILLRAAFAAVAIFWNELAFLHSADQDFRREPRLREMRQTLAAELSRMAEVLAHEDTFEPAVNYTFFHPEVIDQPRYEDYVRTAGARFGELVSILSGLDTSSRTVEPGAPTIESAPIHLIAERVETGR